jgi:hypothetical protein
MLASCTQMFAMMHVKSPCTHVLFHVDLLSLSSSRQSFTFYPRIRYEHHDP